MHREHLRNAGQLDAVVGDFVLAVVVAGLFSWTGESGGSPQTLSYTALLRRQDGTLRIRVEDESIDPRAIPTRPPSDSARR